ncbi:MAG TPA: ATP synthase F1 subunit epsilon [Bryobacteraceae bacterium]|nr:ATP synthase F1 subunit epsilon [Bryobacteraceae bacterium]
MADVFEIEIATPERLLAREKAIRAQIPAKEGYIGVLPDHAPLLSELGIGAMTYTTPGDHRFSLAVCGGFLEINDNVVRVLTDIAEKAHEIDVNQAEKDLKKAQDEMINPALGIDIASALIAARHAQARIDAARKAAAKEE